MKTSLLLLATAFFSWQLFADEVNCTTYPRNSSVSAIEKLASDCTLHKSLAEDENVQIRHRQVVYDKLSNELVNQIKQNSEDISLLTSFYNSNGQDLMMNSKEIADNCRLDSIKTIETCGGNQAGDFYELKLSLLKKKLPSNKKTPFKNDQSLFGILAGKFYSDLGMNESGNNLECPLEGISGSFMLSNQLAESSALDIINLIRNSKDSVFDNYSQLKMIKNTNDPQFIEKFKLYAKSAPEGESAKDYISKFFFDKENQNKLAPTLANQCKKMNKNMNEFLCSDLTELGSLNNKTSINLFNKLNTTDSMEDQYDVDFSDSSVLTAYGMQCLAKDNLIKNPQKRKSANFQSIDQWYDDFTINNRTLEGLETSSTTVNSFCSIYSCKEKMTQSLNSCKKGGPISSAELKIFLGCNERPLRKDCSSDLQRNISYMASLEKLKQASIDQVIAYTPTTSSTKTSSSDNGESKKIISGRLPNFAENYFGVEGSLRALGKPVTIYEVTQKKQEFTENKLVTDPTTYITPVAMKKELAHKQKNTSMSASVNQINGQPTFIPSAISQSTATPSAFVMPRDVIKSIPSKSKSKTQRDAIVEADNNDSRFREEIKKMISEIKDTKQEIADIQKTNSPRTNSQINSTSGPTSSLAINRAEQERLRRLEQSLNDKSNRLEDYRKDLDNRNFATRSGLANSDRPAARSLANDSQTTSTNGAGSEVNDTSGSSNFGNSAKLTSTTNPKIETKITGNNYVAAFIQSGVESSSLSVEDLAKLSAENLRSLGIDSSQPFTLKVIFEGKTYQVPVKSFIYKGAKGLGPVMNPDHKNLNSFLLKSPLFKHYIGYLYDKEARKQKEAAL